MQKSKLSSEASFLLDFSLPRRLTIFTFSGERNIIIVVLYVNVYSPQRVGQSEWNPITNLKKCRRDLATSSNAGWYSLCTVYRHLRSKHTNTVSLSSWVTWIASTCWLPVGREVLSNRPALQLFLLLLSLFCNTTGFAISSLMLHTLLFFFNFFYPSILNSSTILKTTHMLDLPGPISVNHDEQELRLIVSKQTTWLGSVAWLMATHTRGYSCSGTTSISNTFSGLGRGKSKCCARKREATCYLWSPVFRCLKYKSISFI